MTDWGVLDEVDRVDDVLSASVARPQLIFKHSNSCPISSYGLAEAQEHTRDAPDGVDYWLVTVQECRAASNAMSNSSSRV